MSRGPVSIGNTSKYMQKNLWRARIQNKKVCAKFSRNMMKTYNLKKTDGGQIENLGISRTTKFLCAFFGQISLNGKCKTALHRTNLSCAYCTPISNILGSFEGDWY